MQHLEEGMIHAWLDGALSADESARVEQHAKECAECAAMVADARGLIAGASRIVSALDVVPSGVIPKQSTTKVRAGGSLWRTLHLTPFRAALAASVMVAVASMFAGRGNKITVESIALSQPTPAVGAPAPAATLPPALPGPATSAKRDVAASTRKLESRAQEKEKERQQVSARDAVDSAARFAEAPKVAAKAMDVAAQAPAAAPAPTPPTEQVRALSTAAANRVERDSVARAAGFGLQRRASSGALRLTEVSVASAAAQGFEGCYQVIADSADWPRPLPTRFALMQATPTADARERNIVRSMDAAGRVDSSVEGTWRAVADTVVNVTWTAGGSASTFTINRGASSTTAQALMGAPLRPVRVTLGICPR